MKFTNHLRHFWVEQSVKNQMLTGEEKYIYVRRFWVTFGRFRVIHSIDTVGRENTNNFESNIRQKMILQYT